MASVRGTFVVSWSQVELDGLSGAPLSALAIGAAWQWHGDAARVDGPSDVLVLGNDLEKEALRTHAARSVERLIGQSTTLSRMERLSSPEDPLLDSGFSVTDGTRRYTATLIERPGALPLCMFLDELPPKGTELWVSHVVSGITHPNRTGDSAPCVICFTPEAQITTPNGFCAAGDLAEGDVIQTKDDGPQVIRWVGRRRLSGARLYAMPQLRPIRIKGGAVGLDVPQSDLLVSPEHRLVVKGDLAKALFHEHEVLVSARDLVNDRDVMVDRRLREVTYVHLLLDRHSIVFANGVESESLHPATMDLGAIAPGDMARLDAVVPGVAENSSVYGAFARRMLSRSEAAILQAAPGLAH